MRTIDLTLYDRYSSPELKGPRGELIRATASLAEMLAEQIWPELTRLTILEYPKDDRRVGAEVLMARAGKRVLWHAPDMAGHPDVTEPVEPVEENALERLNELIEDTFQLTADSDESPDLVSTSDDEALYGLATAARVSDLDSGQFTYLYDMEFYPSKGLS